MEFHKQILAPITLTGGNYLLWSRTMKTTLCSRGLWAHVVSGESSMGLTEGEAQTDQTTIDNHSKWYQEDQLVLSILQNSLEKSLLEAYSYCENAKELWDTLLHVYGNTSNLMRIFEVKKSLNDLRQEEVEFTKHYGIFRALWAELDMLRPSTIDPMVLNERREQDKVFGLLMTLNPSYTDLIKHLLREEKLPSLEAVCAKVQREQGSQGLFGCKSDMVAAHKSVYKGDGKKSSTCAHCQRKGHTKEHCWMLHPHLKPTWSNKGRDSYKGNFKRPIGSSNQANASSLPDGIQQQVKEASTSPTLGANELVKRSDLDALIKAIKENSGKTVGKSLHASFNANTDNPSLIIDSGASHHMIRDKSLINNLEPALGNVVIANGTKIPIKGVGNLRLFDKNTKAFYMPSFTSNLLSVRRVVSDLNCQVIFGPNECYFQDIETKGVLGKGSIKNDLYLMDETSSKSILGSCLSSTNDNGKLWHDRLGHPHTKALQLIFPRISFDNDKCEPCILGKHCKSVFPNSTHKYDHCFDLIHSDVWTAPCVSREQHRYFVTFIDEKSKYTWITLLQSKDRVLEAFLNFHSYVTNQFNAKIKVFRTDNGGEYTSKALQSHLLKHGIHHETSCPYTPEQNGVAERKNRHLMEVTRSMMFHANIPKRFWGDAVLTACYLINRIPTKVLNDISPFEVLNHTKPVLTHLRVFGCVCFVLVPGIQRTKLDEKSTKAIFIGYSTTQKGYKCYDPETKKVLVSRDVKFLESQSYYTDSSWDTLKDLSNSQSDRNEYLRHLLESLNLSHTSGQPFNGAPSSSSMQENTDEDTPPIPRESPAVSAVSPSRHISSSQQRRSSCHSPDREEGVWSTHDQRASGSDEEPSQRVSGSDEEPSHLVSASKRQRDQPTLVQALDDAEESTSLEPVALRRSTRQRFPPSHWKNTRVYYNHNALVHHDQGVCKLSSLPVTHVAFTLSLDKEQVPRNYEEAIKVKEWREAIQAETQAMEKNHTYDQAVLPKGKKAVSSKWVFTIKYKSTGEIDRYKARLVARGFTQTYGEDYRETFAPVAKLHSVNVVLSLATNLNWELWQMDVKNAFLQGELEEEVYMTPPPGLEDQVGSGNVLRLRKAIYGLKQSPRAWYHKLNVTLRDRGFKRSEVEHTLFTLTSKGGIVVILIYVDDIIISGNDKVGIASTKEYLQSVFDIKDLGELKYFLGIEVCRFKEGLFMSQRKYALDILTSTGMQDVKSAKTPLEEGYKIASQGEQEDGDYRDAKLYRKVVGKLIYLTITRPDLCFAVNQVSQYMQNPKIKHWEMIHRILRYLKGTHDQGIWMGNNGNTNVVGYCDADWAGDRMDRRSTTGYCTLLGGNLVTWKTKKQKVVSCSSAEAEYRAMRRLTTECIWLKQLLNDLGVNVEAPITVHCDNQAAIHIASNSVFHERTKHIEIDCHKVREAIEKGTILPCYTKSSDQLADVFTKATTSRVGASIYPRLGIISLPKH